MRKTSSVLLAITALFFLASIYFYPLLPDNMASHWNINGEVNGYTPKFWVLLLMPVFFMLLTFLFIAIPNIDPLKKNIKKFRKYYNRFVVLFSAFMLALYLQVILWNLGFKTVPNQSFPILLGLLFFYGGILCEKSKRNWFVGVRTPWTISSDRVWERTNKRAGKLFKVAGIISLAGILFQQYSFIFVIVPVIVVAAYAVVYSYLEYQKSKPS